MDTIQEFYRLSRGEPAKRTCPEIVGNTKVGIEIELENAHYYPKISGWQTKRDGSLRNNGIEFTFSGPAGGSLIKRRLSTMREYIQNSSNFEANSRCSVHVHVDVRELTWEQTRQFIKAYIAVEPFLFSICGKERAENIYCLSVYKATSQLREIYYLMKEGPSAVLNIRSKYSAINLKAMHTFGSIEFRGHQGTTDINKIQSWVNILLKLKEFATTKDVKSTIELHHSNPLLLLQEIFEDLLPEVDQETLTEVQENLHNYYLLEYKDKMLTEYLRSKETIAGQRQYNRIKEKLCVD